MIAVDTNVIVRLLVDDDPRQVRAARELIGSGDLWIGRTVVLETAWVLESVYELPPRAIAAALERLLGLPGVHVESPAMLAMALRLYSSGADFADALHLASASASAESFATFDRRLAKVADPPIPVRELR